MTTEQHIAVPTIPNWLRVVLAVVCAVAIFRLCNLVIGFVLWWAFSWRFIPMFVRDLLYRWDSFLVPLVAVIVAVVAARWIEFRLAQGSRSVVIAACLVFGVVAFCPFTVRYETKPVMASPVLIAIQRDYPVETVAAILDRYPHLANASEDDWGRVQPLVTAAYARKTNMVELLIRMGADVDAAVEDLMTVDAKEALSLVLMCAESHNPY